MIYQIFNGDALAYSFPDAGLPGSVIVIREALIDGDLAGDTLQEFWRTRSLSLQVSENDYRKRVVTEFEQIRNAPSHSQFNLWFEYDLFCQVNLWFVLFFIHRLATEKTVYWVSSTHLPRISKQFWTGFGRATSSELISCYENKIMLTEEDLQYGAALWLAYKSGNLPLLAELAAMPNQAFPFVAEVIQAHIERFAPDGRGRPEKTIESIIDEVGFDFNFVMKTFWERESIYGFGDTQIRKIYDKVKARHI